MTSGSDKSPGCEHNGCSVRIFLKRSSITMRLGLNGTSCLQLLGFGGTFLVKMRPMHGNFTESSIVAGIVGNV